jgi:hypothetical protein
MVDNGKYADVPLTFFKQKELGILSGLVDEDILVRRDLTPDSVIGSKEVLNFTFDACRDFLLSDYLLNIQAKQDPLRFEKLVIELTGPQQSVAEGLQQYLFYASRYLADPPTTAFLERQPWYEKIFVTSVLDLDEEDITEQDVNRLKILCLNGHEMTPHIVVNLTIRYDAERFPHANILTLFEMFDSMEDPEFTKLCKLTFGVLTYYPIDRLVENVGNLLLSTGKNWNASYSTLGRLMLYLWFMPGKDYRHPAQELFRRFAKAHPTIASRLQEEHRNASRKGYKNYLWA